jgi:hypothetical protein
MGISDQEEEEEEPTKVYGLVCVFELGRWLCLIDSPTNNFCYALVALATGRRW